MNKRIDFNPLWTTEQRKAAIIRALEKEVPFELVRMQVNGPLGAMDYTGGQQQLTTAKSVTIEYTSL